MFQNTSRVLTLLIISSNEIMSPKQHLRKEVESSQVAVANLSTIERTIAGMYFQRFFKSLLKQFWLDLPWNDDLKEFISLQINSDDLRI